MVPEKPYRQLADGRVLLDYGPMTLSISAMKNGAPVPAAAALGAEKALAAFEELLPFLPQAKSYLPSLEHFELENAPAVLSKMISSVRLLKDPTFTPMAAVAGAFSDLIREEIVRSGSADYVIVNNGGDVSFDVADPRRALSVGVISDIAAGRITHRLTVLGGQGIRGIATSGFGGRSLSRGIASAVTVLADTCALADAAATDIANHTFIESPAVRTCPAEQIDYDTDITGLTVVEEIGPLSREEILRAIENGYARAKTLCDSGMIRGAVLFVRGLCAFLPDTLDIAELPQP